MKKFLLSFLAASVLVACASAVGLQASASEQIIQINAHKFEFSPNIITLKKGVPVVLEFTSSDVVMGFNAPDLKSRVTIIPGKVTRIRIVPENIGTFAFLCDIFCGSGHEEMSGTINVVA